jgi:hypothetical protein
MPRKHTQCLGFGDDDMEMDASLPPFETAPTSKRKVRLRLD